MPTIAIPREIAADGTVTLRDASCTFTFRRSPGMVEIRIEGIDKGQMGSAPLDEIAMALVRERPLELFIDATRASMPAPHVSREWTHFFSLNREALGRVSVLESSRSVELTIAIAQHLSQTGNLIQIYSDPELFGARKAQASKR